MPGLFETFEPQISQGLLDYIQRINAPPNPFEIAGRSLSAFSQNYLNALRDPATRGAALGAGAAGAGEAFRESLSPDRKLQGTLQTAAVLQDLAKYRTGTKENTSEFERLLDARQSDRYKNDSSYAKSVDARLKTFEEEGNDPQKQAYFVALDEYLDPNTAPERKALLKKYIDSLSEVGKGTNVSVSLPAITVDQRTIPTKETVNAAQKDILSFDDTIAKLENAISSYDPTTGTFGGRIGNLITDFKSRLGFKVSKEDEERLLKAANSEAAVGEITARIGNELFGAAFTGAEASKANRFLPQQGESPITVRAKLNYLQAAAKAARDRRSEALRRGLSVEFLSDPAKVREAAGDIAEYLPPDVRKIYEGGSPDSDVAPPGPGSGGGGSGLLPGAPPASAAPPSGLLPPGPPAAAPPPSGTGLLPPGPGAAPPVAPPVATGSAAPPPPTAAPPGLSVQNGKLIAPPPPDRAAANAIVEQAIKQGIPPQIIDQWLRDNGI